MTRNEVQLLLARIEATYQNFKVAPEAAKATVEAWYDILEDFPNEVVLRGVKEYIRSDRKGFAPTPGQIIGHIVDAEKPQLTGMEAWGMVYKAICNSNYHSLEEYEKLPPLIQKAIGSSENLREMASMSLDSMSVEQSHFLRVYAELVEREKRTLSYSYTALTAQPEPPKVEDKQYEAPAEEKGADLDRMRELINQLEKSLGGGYVD